MSEPRTEAGRRLLAQEAYNSRSFALITTEDILAIEAEAAALAAEPDAEERSLALAALQEAIRQAAFLRTESVTIQAPLARFLAAALDAKP